MATQFSEIYSLFVVQIDDYEWKQLTREQLEAVAQKYLLNALLTVQDVVTDIYDFDLEAGHFNSDFEYPEKLLLAKAMKLEWVKEKKYSLELMRKSLGDRDFKATQGYPYLNSLTGVEAALEKEIRTHLIRNSFRGAVRGGGMI